VKTLPELPISSKFLEPIDQIEPNECLQRWEYAPQWQPIPATRSRSGEPEISELDAFTVQIQRDVSFGPQILNLQYDYSTSHLIEAFKAYFAASPDLRSLSESTPDPDDAQQRIVSVTLEALKHFLKVSKNRQSDRQILDSFRGRVERIDNELGYIRFEGKDEGVSYAKIKAASLAEKGIGEGDSFLCEVEEIDGRRSVSILPLPKEELSEADYTEVNHELDDAFPDSLLDTKEN
jgi:hypothetical protein